ncbi:D-alanyl-D-alanine carboxypeptidase family protein [Paracoccus aeridis]|uniref:D-alanyl-D-alanine carboxypeptidase family protein n=1 Tax=Paracoccus aeridis TaxID=1966466 RepID=UPI0022A762C7|nr:D-alanyl-D-alanine carboxypeptidase family protein [Paracoccus aeridis]
MKQFIQTLLLGCIALFGAVAPHAAGAAPFAAFVMDARTGKEIYSKNADARLHPASLTKMMTLYMAFAAIEQGKVRLDSKVTVSSHAAAQPPSRVGLRPGQKIELRYLIRAAAVKSANDAATAIGEGLGGSEAKFAAQMTATARALGMRNTTFRNANGLTVEGHYSSARDLTTLGRRLFYDFPQYYNIFSRRTADAGIATVSSTNRRFLDSYQGADGIKTGYTRAAGFNLTASAQRGNKRIIATVLGGTSTAMRNATMAQLLDTGFGAVPSQVREIRPAGPVLTVEKKRVVQVARADVKPVAPVAIPVGVRPAARASTVPQAAVAAAGAPAARVVAAGAPASGVVARAKSPDTSAFGLTASERPKPRGSRGGTAVAKARAGSTDDAVAIALARDEVDAGAEARADAPPPAAAASTSGLADSARPPRARKRADAAPATAATIHVASAEAPVIEDGEVVEEGDSSDDSIALSRSQKPARRSDTIILAAMEAPEDAPAKLEVVSRAGSGKGKYGVSLGHYKSRSEAEQRLLKTALQESAALDNATRGIADTKRGFEAHFVGLSKTAAELVCGKLNARRQECSVRP